MKRVSFSRQLFISVVSLFLVFVACFIAYQYKREKAYKIDFLNTRLQDYNHQISDVVSAGSDTVGYPVILQNFLQHHITDELRVTLIATDGHVLFDNRARQAAMENHRQRTEFQQALRRGQGYDLRRMSATTGHDYFYSATYIPSQHLVVRTALPYGSQLKEGLRVDAHFLWFTFFLTSILVGIYFFFTRRIGQNIAQLRQFARKMEHEEIPDADELKFPRNELGDISRYIVKLYSQLQKSRADKERLKRQLTLNIAHELKTPVASIQGFLETIVKTPDIPEETRQQFLQRSYAQSTRLSHLVQDISSLTRLDDGQTDMERIDINVAQLVRNISEDVALTLKEKQMRIMSHISPDVVIHANDGLVYSIFRNLIDNALAYAGQGKVITIIAEDTVGPFYTFCVSDNGNGVPEEHLPHLFERFYRVDKGRSRKMGGTGLGLAIVKNAVLFHGGQITVENEVAGGLLFTFTLPKA